jgi:DNA polymerase III sliding clamp (beta) subunit (PCNA family)
VKVAGKVANQRHIPALTCLKVSADAGTVTLEGTDLKTTVRATFGGS